MICVEKIFHSSRRHLFCLGRMTQYWKYFIEMLTETIFVKISPLKNCFLFQEEAQVDSESQLESVLEEELEEKPVVRPPSPKGAETPPEPVAATSPDAAAAAAEPPAEEVAEEAAEEIADAGEGAVDAAAAEEPMQTEEPLKPDEPNSAESSKRLRSDAEAEKSSESDKAEELPRKKPRRESDQSALDLSAPSKDAAETEKRPSLLLSKLQEKQDRPRRRSVRDIEEADRAEKIFRNATERAQVLREMRDRVLSSYKADRSPQLEPNAEFVSLERERLVAEAVEAVACSGKLADLEKAAQQLQAEIRKLAAEAHAKELEWNQLIRKRKLKEEVFLRIHRRKQVLLLAEGAEVSDKRDSKFDSDASEGSDVDGRDAPEHSSGEELLAAALRLGSRNLEEYNRGGSARGGSGSVRPGSPASAPPTGPANSRSKSTTSRQQLSLLQSQLSKPQDPQAHRPQLLLQQLQRQVCQKLRL